MRLRTWITARLALAGVVVFAPGVLLPPVAVAKGPVTVTVEGPGLAAPLRIGAAGRPGGLSVYDLMKVTGLADQTLGVRGPRRPPVALGPAYKITYALDSAGRLPPLRQIVYLTSSAGPVVYTPPGQATYPASTRSGSWTAAGDLSAVLRRHGIRLPDGFAPVRPSWATIDGPGLPATVEIDAELNGHRCCISELVDVTGYDRVVQATAPFVDAPAVAGTGYTVRYVVRDTGDRLRDFRQVLYPATDTGPMVYTPPDQQLFGRTVPGGWVSAPVRSNLFLRSYGIPVSSTPPAGAIADPAGRSDTALPVVLIAAGLAVTVAAARARRVLSRAGRKPLRGSVVNRGTENAKLPTRSIGSASRGRSRSNGVTRSWAAR